MDLEKTTKIAETPPLKDRRPDLYAGLPLRITANSHISSVYYWKKSHDSMIIIRTLYMCENKQKLLLPAMNI